MPAPVAPLTADLETAIANLPKADKATLPEIVAELKDWIGLGLTAMAGGVNETRYVRSWIEGTPPRRPEALSFQPLPRSPIAIMTVRLRLNEFRDARPGAILKACRWSQSGVELEYA